MPANAARRIRSVLASGEPTGAYQGLELALESARRAGARAIGDNPRLGPVEQFAAALKAAGDVLRDIGRGLAGGPKPKGGK